MEIIVEGPSNVQGEQPPMRPPTHPWHHNRLSHARRTNITADNRSPVEQSETGGQKLVSKPPCHEVMKYVVPSLLAIVALKYQSKTESLFVESPASLWCFLVSACVYWLIPAIIKQMPCPGGKCIRIFTRVALASGILSPLSLVSVLLPHQVSFVPLMVGALALVVLAWPLFYSAYTWLHAGISNFTNKVQASRFWANEHNLSEAASSSV